MIFKQHPEGISGLADLGKTASRWSTSAIFAKLLLPALIMFALQSIQSQKRPNIVLFVADDLGATDIGPYGNQEVRTPNIESLAEESMLFLNAFASSPTCSPSRASFLTGLMPFRNGAHENHSGISEGIQTLPSYLEKLGYRSAIAGKYHIGPSEAYPFEMIHGTNVPEPGHEDDGVLWTDLKMGPVDDWLATASGNDGSPFLLVVNDHSPHVFWPENPQYDKAEVRIPSMHIDTDETRKARAKYYTDITKMDSNVGKLVSSLESQNLLDNTVIIFTADQGPQWAFGKWTLYDYGIRVPLLIRWPKVVKQATETGALVSLVDLVPTILEMAGGAVPKKSKPLDGKSFLPVLKGGASEHRQRVYATHTGDNTMNRSPIRMVRGKRYKYILNLAPEIQFTTHMDKGKESREQGGYWNSWVDKSFGDEHAAAVLYKYHNHPKEELYDILADPQESRNLAFEKQYATILEDFRADMARWRKQQGDSEEGPYQASPEKRKGIPYIFE